MLHIIAGEKGKGKTKILLDKANTDIANAKGSIVFLDKNNQHMYELNNKIRLINVRDYCIESANEFVGCVCGIISQDHDIEKIYIDGFLKVACLEPADADPIVEKLEMISEKFGVDIVTSFSQDTEAASEIVKKYIDVAL